MFSNHRILIECLKNRIVWCVIASVGTWLYLLHSRSYGACAATTILVLIAIFGAIDQFVLREITAERITIIPDLGHDLTLDGE